MLCWADKLALSLWALISIGLIAISHSPNAVTITLENGGWLFQILFTIWIPLRLIDWIGGGPRRRAARR